MTTSPKVAPLAGRQLRDPSSTRAEKSVAGSDLSQAYNRRLDDLYELSQDLRRLSRAERDLIAASFAKGDSKIAMLVLGELQKIATLELAQQYADGSTLDGYNRLGGLFQREGVPTPLPSLVDLLARG